MTLHIADKDVAHSSVSVNVITAYAHKDNHKMSYIRYEYEKNGRLPGRHPFECFIKSISDIHFYAKQSTKAWAATTRRNIVRG